MRKSQTTGGENCLIIKVEMVATKIVISMAIADYCYGERSDGFFKLGKKAALEIIKKQLRFHGQKGQFEAFSGNGNGLGENQEEWNNYFTQAESWIDKNYPYLNQPF